MESKTWVAVILVCALSGCSLGEVHERGCSGNGRTYNHNANACLHVNTYGTGEFRCDDGEWKPLFEPFVSCEKCNANATACEREECDGEGATQVQNDGKGHCFSRTCVNGVWVNDVVNKCVDEDNEPDPEEIVCDPECPEGWFCASGNCVESNEPDEGGFSVSLGEISTFQRRANGRFSISLTSAPEKAVVIPIKSENESAGKPSVLRVEFAPDNWNEPQNIDVLATDETLLTDETDYRIVIGPSQSKDTHFDGLSAQSVLVRHYNQFSSLKLDKTEASLLLRKVKTQGADGENSVTFNAILPEDFKDSVVSWEIKNVSDDVPASELVERKKESCNAEEGICRLVVVRKNVDLTSESAGGKKLDIARKLEIKANAANLNPVYATLVLKPYLPLGFNYTYYTKNVRDFHYKKPTGNLSCDYYDKYTVQVFNEDMYKLYIEPNMYKTKDGSLLPTRASVLAAARFFVLQFPKDIPYSGTNKCIKDEKGTKTCNIGGTEYQLTCKSGLCIHNYIWSNTSGATEDNYKERQLYGFNLLEEGYNTLTTMSTSEPIVSDLHPWGCRYTDIFGTEEIYTKACKAEDKLESGLCCSGFVGWVMRNGMFDLGALSTHAFAKLFDSRTGKNTVRRYMDEDAFYGSKKSINRYVKSAEKLSRLKESDFVALKDVDKENRIGMKAGDLLWYSDICECKENQKCPEECDCHNGGHLAMILGIRYGVNATTNKKEISTVYVAEAQSAGNRMTTHRIDRDDMLKDWNCVNGKCYEKESCREVKLIKMGSVYNYFTNEGDTYHYTDLWW